MSVRLNCNIITLTVMSMVILSVFGQQEKKKDDDFCPSIGPPLCIKNVLLNIVNAAKNIDKTAFKIEQDILQRTPSQNALATYIRSQKSFNLPTSKYHDQFMRMNNIDQTDLINLIKEENYAFSYLYNSIEDLLEKGNIFTHSTDTEFKNISFILRKDILCSYRIILNAYSKAWSLSTDKLTVIQKHKTPSFSYNSFSVIIARLLRKWINDIDHVVANIENKLV